MHVTAMKSPIKHHTHQAKARRRRVTQLLLRGMCACLLTLCAAMALWMVRYTSIPSSDAVNWPHEQHRFLHRQPVAPQRSPTGLHELFHRWSTGGIHEQLDAMETAPPPLNTTLIVFGYDLHAVQTFLHDVRSSGFQGHVAILCHADVETCERMRRADGSDDGNGLPVATVQRIGGTIAARASGQLLFVSAFNYLQHADRVGTLASTVVVVDGQEVRWCRNVFERLRSAIRGRPAVSMVSAAPWSLDIEANVNWTLAYVRPNHTHMNRPHITSGAFFGGSASGTMAFLASVCAILNQSRVDPNAPIVGVLGAYSDTLHAALEERMVVAAPFEFGSLLTPLLCEQHLASASPTAICSAVATTDVLVETSLCEAPPAVDDGVHRYGGTCRSQFASRLYAVTATETGTEAPPGRPHNATPFIPPDVAMQWKALKKVADAPDQDALASSPWRPSAYQCPVGRQSLVAAMAWTHDPSEALGFLGSFGRLPLLRRNCTNLLIMARNADLWTSRIAGTHLEGYVRIASTGPYERSQRCHEIGPSLCRHGVLAQWLEAHPDVVATTGLIMTVDLLLSDTLLQVDPFADFVEVHEHEIPELIVGLATQDFIALPTSSDGVATLDWFNPHAYRAHHAALSRLFGESFAAAAYTWSLDDVASIPSSAAAPPPFQEPIPSFAASCVVATPRALLRFTKLLMATIVSTHPTGPTLWHNHQDAAIRGNAVVFALVVAGFHASGYPYSVYLLNPSHSPLVQFSRVRGGDVRRVVVRGLSAPPMYVTCDGHPYAAVQSGDGLDSSFATAHKAYAAAAVATLTDRTA